MPFFKLTGVDKEIENHRRIASDFVNHSRLDTGFVNTTVIANALDHGAEYIHRFVN